MTDSEYDRIRQAIKDLIAAQQLAAQVLDEIIKRIEKLESKLD
jgi:hypothetical protein